MELTELERKFLSKAGSCALSLGQAHRCLITASSLVTASLVMSETGPLGTISYEITEAGRAAVRSA